LVSDQPTPNLTPALDQAFRPDEVILLFQPEMQQRAEWLKAALQPAGIRVATWPVDHHWNIDHIKERVLDLLATDDTNIALNISGGSRPMSIAAHEVFTALDLPVFYVHAERDQVVWINPAGRDAFEIEDRIRLPQFLQAHGVKAEAANREPVSQCWRNLTHSIVAEIDRFGDTLGTLNYLAAKADNRQLSVKIPSDKMGWQALNTLIDRFEDAGLLRCERDYLIFPNEAARFFVNGGWLEHFVFSTVHHLRGQLPHIHDVAQGLTVTRGEKPDAVYNELDVAFLNDNSLYLIECKTRQFHQGGSEAIYKLDALTEKLGGLRARSMLVSWQPLNKADHKRAARDHIGLCVGRDLQQLERFITRWVQP